MTEETMGKRIARHRKRNNLTQDAMAEQLGVTAQAVSKWENDQSCPDIAMLPKLSRLIGITVDELLGLEPAQPETPRVAEVVPQQEENKKEWNVELGGGRRSGIAVALWILLTGALLLVAGMRSCAAGFWELLWPSALIVFGGFSLLRRVSVLRLGCTLFGIYAALNALRIPHFLVGRDDLLLPGILLLLGLSLLTEALRKPRRSCFCFTGMDKHTGSTARTEGEGFRCSISFGEDSREIVLPRLSRGEADVSFGELTVDLTGCGEIAEGCRLRGTASFGELEFVVPASCRVEHRIRTGFGNVETEGRPAPDADRVIFLEGSASFGEIKIKYL